MAINTLNSDHDSITTQTSPIENLSDSLTEISPVIEGYGEILLCPWDELEENDMTEIQKALVTAEAIPSCLMWGSGTVLYAKYNSEFQEYFLGIVSEKDLMNQITPFDLNQEFCFGAFWSKKTESVRVVSKFLSQSMEYPLKGEIKPEHVEAIKSLIEIVQNIKGGDCDYEYEEN